MMKQVVGLVVYHLNARGLRLLVNPGIQVTDTGDDKLTVLVLWGNLKHHVQHLFHFLLSAPRQERYDWAVADFIFLVKEIMGLKLGDFIQERIAYEVYIPFEFLEKIFLKRQDGIEMIHIFLERIGPLLVPRPYLRRNIIMNPYTFGYGKLGHLHIIRPIINKEQGIGLKVKNISFY